MPIRISKCYKPKTQYRPITPKEDPETLPWDWQWFGPWDLNFPQEVLDQPMQDLAIRLMGCERIPLKLLGISKLHRVALARHQQAGRLQFEVGTRKVPILDEEGEPVGNLKDDGEIDEDASFTEEDTFVSPTDELEVWLNNVVGRSRTETKPTPDGEATPQEADPDLEAGAVDQSKVLAGRGDDDLEDAGQRVKWRDVAERLERLRGQGEPYESRRYYAELFSCSLPVVQKAIERTPALRPWAKPESTCAPKTTRLSEVVADNTPQQREPDPAELLADRDALDAALAYCIDQAPAEFKAEIHEMTPDQRDNLAREVLKHPDRAAEILGLKA